VTHLDVDAQVVDEALRVVRNFFATHAAAQAPRQSAAVS
jgi:hypothetical protein